MKHTFAPYLKHLGKTPEEQLEKNKPLMTWLQQKMEEKVTEEEAEEKAENTTFAPPTPEITETELAKVNPSAVESKQNFDDVPF